MMNVKTVDGALKAAHDFYIVFSSADCAPCGPVKKIVDEQAVKAGVPAFVVDVDESPEEAGRYGVQGLPTVIYFDGGKEWARKTGSATAEEIERLRTVY